MGMTYSVEASIKFKNNDPSAFCNCIKEYISETNGKSALYQLDNIDLDKPFDCFKAATVPDAYADGDTWYADFDASYGWESVMYDIFEAALEFTENGSSVTIWPDDAMSVITNVNGEVIRTFQDYDELEEEEMLDDEEDSSDNCNFYED